MGNGWFPTVFFFPELAEESADTSRIAREIAIDFKVLEAGLSEHRNNRRGLAGADFEDQRTVGNKHPRQIRGDCAIGTQAIIASIES